MLGYRIKSFRTYADCDPKAVADVLGVTVEEYLDYERGIIKPTIDDLIALADFYKVSLDDFCGTSPRISLYDPELERILNDRSLRETIKLSDLSWDERELVLKYRAQLNKEAFMDAVDAVSDAPVPEDENEDEGNYEVDFDDDYEDDFDDE